MPKDLRIGILGGTFDPIHFGHLSLARAAQERLNLDKIVFMPAFLPPHKTMCSTTDYALRYQMTALAIKDEEDFLLSDLERRLGGQSFTYDTLRTFKEICPACQLFFLTGADALKGLDKWYRWQEILDLAQLVVTNRPGFAFIMSEKIKDAAQKSRRGILLLSFDAEDISSTELRALVKTHGLWQSMVPEAVADFILSNHLYEGGD